jgi:hypothetical protein
MAGKRVSGSRVTRRPAAVADGNVPSTDPAARPPTQPTIAALARRHADAALAALIEVMADRSASPAARISAASAVLNWGFGKSAGAMDEGVDGPVELVIRWLTAPERTKPSSGSRS